MELQTDAVQQACRTVSRQMREHTRNLALSFIVHNDGQHLESLNLAGQELLTHPAAEQALRLLKTSRDNENSAFLGLAVWRRSIFFGLASNQNMMALTTINSDEFEELQDVRAQAWAMAWHAVNLYRQRNTPTYEHAFATGLVTLDLDDEELALANLKADVFSAVMCTVNGDKNMIGHLAQMRSLQSLQCRSGALPEHYPFALVRDATQTAYNEMISSSSSRRKQIEDALQIAEHIAQAYDEQTLRQWSCFCKPAQEMAWRGDSRETILGAAVSTSQDTYVRAAGFLISDLTKIKPASILTLEKIYSPFAEEKYNSRLHDSMVEQVFENAVHAGLANFNGASFIEAANEQNEKLSNGHILGWCAAALQAAGRAFDAAVVKGSKTPEQDARREFDGVSVRTTWETLKQIGENIVEQYRQGYATTLSDLMEFCGDRPAFAGIASSIAFTIKDPAYLKKLEIANDLKAMPSPGLSPATPAFNGPAFNGPAIFNGPRPAPGPSLGLGSSSTMPPPARTPQRHDDIVETE